MNVGVRFIAASELFDLFLSSLIVHLAQTSVEVLDKPPVPSQNSQASDGLRSASV